MCVIPMQASKRHMAKASGGMSDSQQQVQVGGAPAMRQLAAQRCYWAPCMDASPACLRFHRS